MITVSGDYRDTLALNQKKIHPKDLTETVDCCMFSKQNCMIIFFFAIPYVIFIKRVVFIFNHDGYFLSNYIK